jgi:Putative Actinobacterial Holin-X, holin superfamily III
MRFHKPAPPRPDTAVPDGPRAASQTAPRHADRRSPSRATVPALARNALEDLVALLSAQIELARTEIASDLHAASRLGLRLLIFVPLFTVGYVLLVGAGLLTLASSIGWIASLLLAGVLHVGIAIVGFRRIARLAAQLRFLDRTTSQLGTSIERIAEETRPALGPRP